MTGDPLTNLPIPRKDYSKYSSKLVFHPGGLIKLSEGGKKLFGDIQWKDGKRI